MKAGFNELLSLMQRLRSPDGCPWDREQTYETLAPMVVEEAYEVFDAAQDASDGQTAELCDELGDLLFLIVFYAQIAAERGEFTIEDVTNAIHTKMVRRHPHVFGDVSADTSSEVLKNWEVIKAEERRDAGKGPDGGNGSILDEVSIKTPALMEAQKLSKRAASVGFDWDKVEDVFDKLEEEIAELREAVKTHRSQADEQNYAHVREELGDLLFAVANIARHLKVEPEAALKLANRKFRTRFSHIERELRARDRRLEETSLDEMENLWQQAKKDRG